MPSDQITAIIVNYKTYELTRQAIWSLSGHYPELPVVVVDNNSEDGSAEALQSLASSIPGVQVNLNEKNKHHGPAMEQIARTVVNTPYFLTFDSDALLYKPGLLEAMLAAMEEETYAMGHQIWLNEKGFKTGEAGKGFPYVHPFCALFRTAVYRSLPPFEKHGSPCLTNERAAFTAGWKLSHFPAKSYVFHRWRGTVEKTGHLLGLRSKWEFITHKLGI